jgi:hypothetical protein
MPDSGEKKDFSISKLGSQGLERPLSKSMEVIAPAFFDHLGVLRGYLSLQFEKLAI